MSDRVLTERRDRIGIITLNRPEILNALDLPMVQDLERHFVALEQDPDIHCIVVTGAGDRAFIAGADVADLGSRQALQHYQELGGEFQRIYRHFETCEKPTLVAVNGTVVGGGVELMLTFDIRVMSGTARLGLPEISIGLFPGAGGSQRLIRQIAPCMARELMFTGQTIDADEVYRLGLVNRVVSQPDVLDVTLEIASRIASKSPLALTMLKRTLSLGSEMPPSAALAYEHSVNALLFDSEDAHEGCNAFLEKRAPMFRGR